MVLTMLTICRLQGWIKLVSFQIKIYLGHYSFFDDFSMTLDDDLSKRVGHVVPGVVVYLMFHPTFHAWVGWVSEIK